MWFKVDDGFAVHPKAVIAGNAALGLWVRAGAWAGAHLTDGAVPRHLLASLGGKPKDATALVAAGLWEATEDGWVFHDWLDYNPSKVQVEAQKAWDRQRMELHRDKALVAAIRRRDCDRCRYCGHQVRWNVRRGPYAATYDHVIPRGENSLENVVVACGPCNMAKGARTPQEAGMELLAPGSVGRDAATAAKVTDLFGTRSDQVRSKNGPGSEQLPDPTRPDPSSSLREEEDGSQGTSAAPGAADAQAPASGRADLAEARQRARRGASRYTGASHALPVVRAPQAPTSAPQLREPITAQTSVL